MCVWNLYRRICSFVGVGTNLERNGLTAAVPVLEYSSPWVRPIDLVVGTVLACSVLLAAPRYSTIIGGHELGTPQHTPR